MNTRCTFCDEIKTTIPEGENMCRDCDRESEAQDKVFRASTRSRKCRECQGPTGAGRYFYCVKCVADLGSEDEWDSHDDVEEACRVVAAGLAKAKQKQFKGPKHCKKCGVTKPREAFWADSRSRDGFAQSCSDCLTKQQKQEKQDALLEQGRMETAVEVFQLEGVQLSLLEQDMPTSTNQ